MMAGFHPVQLNTAVLPDPGLQQAWLAAGWGLVAAATVYWLLCKLTRQRVAAVVPALCCGVWTAFPGPWGGAFWLGLAFQSPSVVTVLVCCGVLLNALKPDPHALSLARSPFVLIAGGCILGWALLLDTFGVFPGALYAWGFGATAPAAAIAVMLLLLALRKPNYSSQEVCALALGGLLSVVLHLPSGNVFDALLDPFLWLVLHGLLAQQLRGRLIKK